MAGSKNSQQSKASKGKDLRKYLKVGFRILSWGLFLWGAFWITNMLWSADFSFFKDWEFYPFILAPLFFVFFIRRDLKALYKKASSDLRRLKDLSIDQALKVSIVAGILIVTISFAYYFLLFLPKKEKQRVELQEQERLASEVQEKKEYIAKRKNECYSIYEKERRQWNNVEGNEYDENEDICVIRYKATHGEWAGIDCDKFLPKEGQSEFLQDLLRNSYLDCTTNTFTKEF